jgi:hypothetical protein
MGPVIGLTMVRSDFCVGCLPCREGAWDEEEDMAKLTFLFCFFAGLHRTLPSECSL